jgi:hypothetical protein
MQAMNWGTLVGNVVQPVRRGGANSLFNRIGGCTVNNAVLITDFDWTPIKYVPPARTCIRKLLYSRLDPYDRCARPRLSSTAMRTTTAMCAGGHSFPASTMIQWYRAPSSQRCSGRLAASGSSFHVCALIDMRVPSHFTSGAYFSSILIADVLIPRQPTRVRPGYVAAAFCGSTSQAAFLSARSLARPRTRLPRVPPCPSGILCATRAGRPPSPSRTLPTLPS